MNKNIKLAVAGAVLALSATAANAGIVIPAGEWTVDISGNVNAFTEWSAQNGTTPISGGLVSGAAAGGQSHVTNSFGNGLLPNFISIGGSTRQNDLDVSFTISLQPGTGLSTAAAGPATGAYGAGLTGAAVAPSGINDRQAFITFGDKSWGSVKLGKDLGIFASDAILSDMTLLGVGAGVAGGNTTLGRIGAGYLYADWKPQIAYTTPNFSGFQATAGISQTLTSNNDVNSANGTTAIGGAYAVLTNNQATIASPAYEGKASYAFNANGVDGKIWVSGIAQRMGAFQTRAQAAAATSGTAYNNDTVAYGGDIGTKLAVSGAELVAYYYGGSGLGTTTQFYNGYGLGSDHTVSARDSYGGYVQATYVLPTKTKVGVSWGESKLDTGNLETLSTLVKSNEMWTAGIYHPLTKHLNLVAEYNNVRSEAQGGQRNTANSGSLGAILFF